MRKSGKMMVNALSEASSVGGGRQKCRLGRAHVEISGSPRMYLPRQNNSVGLAV